MTDPLHSGDTPLSRGAGVALWRQISETLRQEIATQAFPPGERMPTEAQLAVRFGVNRHTVRHAIADLETRGLVRVDQGRGMFVRQAVVDYALGRRTRFSANIRRLNREPSGELLRSGEAAADATIARALGVRRGTRLIVLEVLGRADGVPIGFGTHYFPARHFAGLAEAWAETRSITAALTQLGVGDYERRSTRVTARLPDARECEVLEVPRTRPVLVSEAVNVDRDGRPIEYGVARLPSDRVQLVVES